MITALNILVLVISAVLSVSVLPHFRILGVAAILPLFFIIQLAYFRKGFEPLLLAAVTGIFFDLFSPYPFGFYLLLFLITAGLVRYFFSEGMRRLSFWHYLLIVAGSLALYYGAQLGWLYFKGQTPTLLVFYPIVWGFLVNFGFAALYFVFGQWYFEQMLVLEDRIKRR